MRQFNNILLTAALVRPPFTTEVPTSSGNKVFVMEATVAALTRRPNGSVLTSYLPVSMVGPQAANLHERIQAAGNAPIALVVDGVMHREVWDKDGETFSRLTIKGLRVEMADSAHMTFNQDAKGGWRLDDGTLHSTIGGNVTRDAELRFTPAGDAVVDLDVALNNRYTTRSGEVKEETTFVRVTLWRELAQQATGIKKGAAIITEGFVTSESWPDKDTGKIRSTLKVEATKLTVIATPVKAAPTSTQPVAESAARTAPTPPGSEPFTEDMVPPVINDDIQDLPF